MRFLLCLKFTILVIILSCSGSCNNSNASKAPADPCDTYEQALNGVFQAELYEGTVTFIGGLEGTMETNGHQFNSMICKYVISDCVNGLASMTCEDSPFGIPISILGPDQVQINENIYNRIKN